MSDTHESFAFVDAGRTFVCRVETPLHLHGEAWWWFRVSSEARQRYAPFRAAPGDTSDAVRDRVVAYYDALLARRAEPSALRWRWRPTVTPAPVAPLEAS